MLLPALATLACAGVLALLWLLRARQRRRLPLPHVQVARVAALYIYPVKSCGAISLQEAGIHRFGLVNDRRWLFADSEGNFTSQRTHPRMALIQPILHEDSVTLTAPSMPPLTVKRIQDGEPRRIRVWRTHGQGVDCGDEPAQWIQKFLRADNMRMFFLPDGWTGRNTRDDPKFNSLYGGHSVTWCDGCPVLIASLGSERQLNRMLREVGVEDMSVMRFRPNIVLDECAPFAEDFWTCIRVGDVVMNFLRQCTRCNLTTVDPATGEKDARQQPLARLKEVRMSGTALRRPHDARFTSSPVFGSYYGLEDERARQVIRVGDPVFS